MENSKQINLEPATISRSAAIIDKMHSCTDCPIRKLAMKQPQSLFAKMHNWHRTWWPGWKAHLARTCPFTAKASMQS